MTLGRFLQGMYTSPGRKSRGKWTLCNVMIVMLLSGLWHGAADLVLWDFTWSRDDSG
ncbi:MAG: hypothetical protein ACLURV_12260 [Gallintestinimicrobium sp.]